MRLLVDTFIPGHPRTKGSLEHRGSGQLTESVAGSTSWRRLMAQGLRQAWGPRIALDVAVRVSGTFYLPCARGMDSLIAARSGDVDKLTRNLLDAIAVDETGKQLGAGIIVNDSQVVGIVIEKTMASDSSGPHGRGNGVRPQGVHVQIWQVPA